MPYEKYKEVLDELNRLKDKNDVDLTAMTVEELTAYAKDSNRVYDTGVNICITT